MTWTVIAAALGAVVLFGMAVTVLPAIWRFTVAVSRIPAILDSVAHEFSPDNETSMRRAVDQLHGRLDTLDARLTETRHDVIGVNSTLKAWPAGQETLISRIEKVSRQVLDIQKGLPDAP